MNEHLNVPSLEWLGLKLSDVESFSLNEERNIMSPLSELDKRLARTLQQKLDVLEEFDLKNEVTISVIKFSSFLFHLSF